VPNLSSRSFCSLSKEQKEQMAKTVQLLLKPCVTLVVNGWESLHHGMKQVLTTTMFAAKNLWNIIQI